MSTLDTTMRAHLRERIAAIESELNGTVAFYYGEISESYLKAFRDFLEKTAAAKTPGTVRLIFFLNTPGGSVEAAEKMVEMMRHHFSEVYFVVPDAALSAGTILCMAGDKIFMDYSSSLGPIDPQVWNGKAWVPALGYLDKVESLLARAAQGGISDAEFVILQNQDLAQLSRYEQVRDLTVTLLRKWLVQYKFRDWSLHRTNPELRGRPVTKEEKEGRAEEIAKQLGNNKLWHSHGRRIGARTLSEFLRLEIDDYSTNDRLRAMIREYNDLLTDYIAREGFKVFQHSREYF